MFDILLWLYMVNAVLLINHEIDSAYWKEWELFKLPGGIGGFLLIHFPLLFLVLYGLLEVYKQSHAGLIFSMVLSFAGIFAFFIHMVFIKKGRKEFKVPISIFILVTTLIVSIIQAFFTIRLMGK
jgi:predicted neutral ceramidase superfamily lipid hydrolase